MGWGSWELLASDFYLLASILWLSGFFWLFWLFPGGRLLAAGCLPLTAGLRPCGLRAAGFVGLFCGRFCGLFCGLFRGLREATTGHHLPLRRRARCSSTAPFSPTYPLTMPFPLPPRNADIHLLHRHMHWLTHKHYPLPFLLLPSVPFPSHHTHRPPSLPSTAPGGVNPSTLVRRDLLLISWSAG